MQNDLGLTKIGITSSLKQRLAQLKNASGVGVNLYWNTSKLSRQTAKYAEHQAHLHFKDLRMKGEWFVDLNPDDAVNYLNNYSVAADLEIYRKYSNVDELNMKNIAGVTEPFQVVGDNFFKIYTEGCAFIRDTSNFVNIGEFELRKGSMYTAKEESYTFSDPFEVLRGSEHYLSKHLSAAFKTADWQVLVLAQLEIAFQDDSCLKEYLMYICDEQHTVTKVEVITGMLCGYMSFTKDCVNVCYKDMQAFIDLLTTYEQSADLHELQHAYKRNFYFLVGKFMERLSVESPSAKNLLDILIRLPEQWVNINEAGVDTTFNPINMVNEAITAYEQIKGITFGK